MRNARDGLPARVFRPWTREKLVYLQKYASAFMKAMVSKKQQGKWEQLVYLDLLAGPGRGIDADTGDEPRSPMDGLWGGKEWRDLPPAKLAAGTRLNAEEALSVDRPWVLRFRSKIAGIGFQFQDEADPCFTNEKNVPMYHLLFFSQDPAGLTIWQGIKRIEPSGQRTLPL